MSDIKTYLALLTVYENNFRVLHWKLYGSEFHTTHERFAGYYETLGTYMDETAELILTIGESPINSTMAIEVLQDEDIDAIIIHPEQNYDNTTADTAAQNMFQLLYSISVKLSTDEELPVDVADVFMDHAKYYRMESIYKIGRKLLNTND